MVVDRIMKGRTLKQIDFLVHSVCSLFIIDKCDLSSAISLMVSKGTTFSPESIYKSDSNLVS